MSDYLAQQVFTLLTSQIVEQVITAWTGLPCPALQSLEEPAYLSQSQVRKPFGRRPIILQPLTAQTELVDAHN